MTLVDVGFWIVFFLGLAFSYTSDVWVGFNGFGFRFVLRKLDVWVLLGWWCIWVGLRLIW